MHADQLMSSPLGLTRCSGNARCSEAGGSAHRVEATLKERAVGRDDEERARVALLTEGGNGARQRLLRPRKPELGEAPLRLDVRRRERLWQQARQEGSGLRVLICLN